MWPAEHESLSGIVLMCGRSPCEALDCTWSEAHRAECEARTVMRWTKKQRTDYYALVAEKRGNDAVMKLVENVKRLWKKS